MSQYLWSMVIAAAAAALSAHSSQRRRTLSPFAAGFLYGLDRSVELALAARPARPRRR
jgi:hypothetical protein